MCRLPVCGFNMANRSRPWDQVILLLFVRCQFTGRKPRGGVTVWA
jgi:hypothetical protein